MFIELTETGGKPRFINVNKIELVWQGTTGACAVYFSFGALHVEESYEKVKQLIADEVAAERGY